MTETEKMFSGKMYDPFTEGMPEARRHAHELCQKYNAIPESETEKREEILCLLMPDHAEGVYLQGRISPWAKIHMQISISAFSMKTASL